MTRGLEAFAVGPHTDLRGRDTCETCAHRAEFTSPAGVRHEHCCADAVVKAFRRDEVSAGIARDEVCGGAYWRRATR
ncbi:MAG: hypothetical protein WCK28_00200 [Burkholderiales bacterium]|jgi:hypothetical protein